MGVTQSNRYKEIVSALFGITKMINSGVSQAELLNYIAERTVRLLRGDSCSIFLIEEGSEVLLAHGASGLSAQDQAGAVFARGEGVAGWVAQHGAPALIDDVRKDPRYVSLPVQNINIASLLCIPLSMRAEVLGVMTVSSAKTKAFTREDEALLTFLGNSIVRDIENARLYQMAITDSLTKAYNRQFLLHRLPDEIERHKRYGDQFAIVLLDVDHFKRLNDQFGHVAGDYVLKELSRCLKKTLREIDALVRYGGEEFLMLLPKTDLEGAATIAERVRKTIEDHVFHHLDNRLHITLSLGVGSFTAEETEQSYVDRVDRALYRAKQGGRNRVEVDRGEDLRAEQPFTAEYSSP
jgi:diguanylate cyclase (GGDEF)-like protein